MVPSFKAKTTLWLCLAALLISIPPAPAQTFYGSIVGAIKDASGATLPEVNVTLTNLGTSERRSMQTDQTGAYQFVNLVPGRYRLEMEKSGFKRITREPILVEVQAAVRIDATMEIGEVTQTVEVVASTPLL